LGYRGELEASLAWRAGCLSLRMNLPSAADHAADIGIRASRGHRDHGRAVDRRGRRAGADPRPATHVVPNGRAIWLPALAPRGSRSARSRFARISKASFRSPSRTSSGYRGSRRSMATGRVLDTRHVEVVSPEAGRRRTVAGVPPGDARRPGDGARRPGRFLPLAQTARTVRTIQRPPSLLVSSTSRCCGTPAS